MTDAPQMMLWPDLPVPDAPPTPIRPPRRKRRGRSRVVQLAFDFKLRRLACAARPDDDEDDDDDPFYSYPVHRVIGANHAPPLDTGGAPRCVWDLAAVVKDAGRMQASGLGRFGAAEGFTPKRPTVQRADGVVKVQGAAYPANRWDEERIEQERLRRAKQRPPKPTRKAKTRSAKLRELIGPDHDD